MTTPSGLTFFDDQFHGAELERVTQNLAVLNANSGGTIRVMAGAHAGRSRETTRFGTVSGLIQSRDPSSAVATVTPTTSNNEGQKEIKIYYRVAHDVFAQDWFDQGFTSEAGFREQSRLMGLDFGDQKIQTYVNTALAAILGGLLEIDSGSETAIYDNTGESTPTLNYTALGNGLRLVGDRAAAVRAWGMRGIQHADVFLNVQGSDAQSFQIGDLMLVQGAIPLLNRRGIVTDSASFVKDNGSAADTYYTMGLFENAVIIEETEAELRDFSIVKGTGTTAPANMQYRLDIQYAATLKLRGLTYAGADNPTDATLATAAAWTQIANDLKNGPGIAILTD